MDQVFKSVSHVADPSNLTDKERLHVPVIELPDAIAVGEMFPVTVKVGRSPHTVEPGHYVQFIDLYAGMTLLTRVSFTPTLPKPKMTFFLVLDEPVKLQAVAFCNLDGFWASERWVGVG